MRKSGLQIALGTVSMLCIGTAYIALRNRKRDTITSKFLLKLRKTLNPLTTGLLNEEALDVKYADTVIGTVQGSVIVLKKSTATQYASEIHKSFRPWYRRGDNEAGVYHVFRNLKDKVQVSQVAKAYQRDYELNLRDQLKNRFDTDEIKTVLDIILKLPKYRKL